VITSAAVLDLGQRLERERARRFVGRAAEFELFAARLQAGETAADQPDIAIGHSDLADLFSVLWVHGPGGIGKSTLLMAYGEAARQAGFTVAQLDGGRIRPTPAGIQAAVHDSLAVSEAERALMTSSVQRSEAWSGNRSVVIVDAAERLGDVEEWLREKWLPTLPGGTLVVIAGRARRVSDGVPIPAGETCCGLCRCAICCRRPSTLCLTSRGFLAHCWDK
jgi:hypothetical protein